MKFRKSYKIFVIHSVLTFLFYTNVYAQEIYWKNVSIGANISFLYLTNDFGDNWENSPAFGGSINYKIDENLSVIGEGFISKINSKEKKFPDVIFLGLLGGIKYLTYLTDKFSFNLSGGIQSNTFKFENEEENRLEDNTNESEFGLFVGTGLGTSIFREFPIEINIRYQSIFSSPVAIKMYSAGLTVFIF